MIDRNSTWVVLTLCNEQPVDVRIFTDRRHARRFATARRAQGWRSIVAGAIVEPTRTEQGSAV